MSEESFLKHAESVAQDVLARHAADVDATARWPIESITALRQAGLLGLTIPTDMGGRGAGARAFASVTRILAERCASTAMIYLMHVCGAQVIVGAREFPRRGGVLREVAGGRHLCTLAFSEKGSRSHFWAPVSQAVAEGDCQRLSAEKSWVTSAGHANSYIISTRAAGRTNPTESTLYFIQADAPGLSVSGTWDGLGLRGNSSAAMKLTNVTTSALDRVSPEGEGFAVMLGTVLPWFQVGSAAVSLGIAAAALAGTRQHLLAAKLEHLGRSLASLMNLRARLAQMQILVDSQGAFLERVAGLMEEASPDALLPLLESKAAAAEAALQVTDLAMRTCGGAAFSRHLSVERNFRDARAAAVMAPTTDVLYDFIGKTLLGLPLFE
jgi:alkylation response protein AidB-like acyl-CoA dehydrogenase